MHFTGGGQRCSRIWSLCRHHNHHHQVRPTTRTSSTGTSTLALTNDSARYYNRSYQATSKSAATRGTVACLPLAIQLRHRHANYCAHDESLSKREEGESKSPNVNESNRKNTNEKKGEIQTRGAKDVSTFLAGRRIYHFFINERGNLYHLYDVKGLVPALQRVQEDSNNRQGLPSGPAHIRDWPFVNFFTKNLYVNTLHVAKGYATCDEEKKINVNENDTKSGKGTDVVSPPASNNSNLANGFIYPTDLPLLTDPNIFPYVSFCGKEVNFVACERLPIVFKGLVLNGEPLPEGLILPPSLSNTTGGETSEEKEERRKSKGSRSEEKSSSPPTTTPLDHPPLLVFGGTLAEVFDPAELRVDDEGYLYHPIASLSLGEHQQENLQKQPNIRAGVRAPRERLGKETRPSIGLVGAEVGLRLGFEFIDELIIEGDEDEEVKKAVSHHDGGEHPRDKEGGGRSCGAYAITWGSAQIRIKPLEKGRL